ncbi:hypothetical protein P3H15_41205 [Rhodococcus sp. T2V]|uniref:hypothetical protein n=1 Tax=Rhodococcus sp. T2V TaxID=3034164 RepID=UPI0023E2687C|nr:hypothetical protein [Rhodococcus sp. T2V]MDF3311411.1 hypothetical protein [Rhodococcus sp. T2V]
MSSTSLCIASFNIASFNVENLFARPRAMGSDDKKLILDLLVALDLDRSDTATYAVLRQVRG